MKYIEILREKAIFAPHFTNGHFDIADNIVCPNKRRIPVHPKNTFYKRVFVLSHLINNLMDEEGYTTTNRTNPPIN